MTRSSWGWLRPTVAAVVLTVVVWQLGVGPFLDGIRAVDATAQAFLGPDIFQVPLSPFIQKHHQDMKAKDFSLPNWRKL